MASQSHTSKFLPVNKNTGKTFKFFNEDLELNKTNKTNLNSNRNFFYYFQRDIKFFLI